jgi:hypothetical protein
MRSILLTAASIGVACMLSGSGAAAQTEPWCSVARDGDGENCRFSSYEQCTVNGLDGWCVRNSRAAVEPAPAMGPTAQMEVPTPGAAPPPAPARPARKKPDTKQGSIVRPPPSLTRPATNIVPTRAAASVSIPLPDRALLAPLPEFNCQFDTASLEANAPQQPTLASTQASPGADAAARIKADYEQQCYRHTELISRDRLQHLQASVGETIKAVRRNDHAGVKIPLPDQALLAPATGFDCEFKTASVEGASAPQSSPASGQAAPDAAALRAKLDYEIQCYRHAAIIWRDRIQHLQASLGETITAVNRGKPSAAEPRRGARN